MGIFRQEPTLALSEYPVKNWSFRQKLSDVYANLLVIKQQRSLYGLSVPEPKENLRSKKIKTETRNSRPAQDQSNKQNQAYYMMRQT